MCSLFLPEISSFIAAMLFAVHPIHTEAVSKIVFCSTNKPDFSKVITDFLYIFVVMFSFFSFLQNVNSCKGEHTKCGQFNIISSRSKRRRNENYMHFGRLCE